MASALALVVGLTSLAPGAVTVSAASKDEWDGKTYTIPSTDENGVFQISTGAELAWFARYVNQGNSSVNAKLTKTVYLNSSSTTNRWIMIGDSEEHPFSGIFDGNGKQVVGMIAQIGPTNPGKRYGGLFGVIDGGTVENVTVTGSVLSEYSQSSSLAMFKTYSGTGGIAGFLKSGAITGCTNYAVTTTDNNCFYRNAGGIVGINYGLVMRCTNGGEIACPIKMTQYHMGGICGLMDGAAAQILYCRNDARVEGFFRIGGIAGRAEGGSEIQNCVNYGDVGGNWYVGGIAGSIGNSGTMTDGTPKETTIRNVYSLGELFAALNYGAGIVGDAGYDASLNMDHPSYPVVENAYTIAQVRDLGCDRRGAIIGEFRSGVMGNVYGLKVSGNSLNPVGERRAAATDLTGSSEMLTEDQMKAASFVSRLGDAFVACTKYYEDQNAGYPLLAWQVQTTTVQRRVNEAIKELLGWLTQANREKYGLDNYAMIENIVNTYVIRIGQVVKKDDVDALLNEAREKLNAIRPINETEQELQDAIDNAILKLEEYRNKLVEESELTEEQVLELDELVNSYEEKIAAVQNSADATDLLKEGRAALDDLLQAILQREELERVRESAIAHLTAYQAERDDPEPYKTDILEARNRGIRLIKAAKTIKEITSLLSTAESEIDEVISRIPGEGGWSGDEDMPPQDEAGVFQISTPEQFAWFASAVNEGDTAISAVLLADINLGSRDWTPIGSAELPFEGTFDGQGHTIKGLKVTGDYEAAGLFGVVGSAYEQTIRNLTVQGSVSPRTAVYAGGIVGRIVGASTVYLENCHNQVNVTVDTVSANYTGVGGIVGSATNAQIQNSSNTGSVMILNEAITGRPYYTGGIVGMADENALINRCYNAGSVTGFYSSGGVAGGTLGNGNAIAACYNTGRIVANYYGGGLIGKMGMNNEKAAISCSYSTGYIGESARYLGALFGSTLSSSLPYLYALKRADQPEMPIVGYDAGFVASGSFVSSEELQAEKVLNDLNMEGANFIRDYLGTQNGYPILEWQLTLEDFKYGTTNEIRTMVTPDQYAEEDWPTVASYMEAGAASIAAAGDRDGVYAAYNAAKQRILSVESKEDAAVRRLAEAKDAALDLVNTYRDPETFRDEEKLVYETAVANARKALAFAESIEEVDKIVADFKSVVDPLPTAAQIQQTEDQTAADEVINAINGIGEVIYAPYVKNSINIARAGYDALTDAQKALVTNYQVLVDAETEYQRLQDELEITEDDTEAARIVDEMITAIGPVTADSGKAIKTARDAYNGLTDKQKGLVTQSNVLAEAEAAYDRLKAAEVDAAIAAIGPVNSADEGLHQKILAAQSLYDKLTKAQKALVATYETVLNPAKTAWANHYNAQAVIDTINAIGDVTLKKEDKIMAAVKLYNNNNAEVQGLVSNYATLVAALDRLSDLKNIKVVQDAINAIGIVSKASGGFIEQARAAYNALPDRLKGEVPNYDMLLAAEAAYAAVTSKPATKPVPQTFNIPTGHGRVNRPERQRRTGNANANYVPNDSVDTSGLLTKEEMDELAKEEEKREGGSLDDIAFMKEKDKKKAEAEADAAGGAAAAAEESGTQGEEAGTTAVAGEAVVGESGREKRLLLLAVTALSLGGVAAALFAAIRQADKKRKDKSVRY